jgi:hypothetical protein
MRKPQKCLFGKWRLRELPAKQRFASITASLVLIATPSPPPIHAQQFGLQMGSSVDAVKAQGITLQPTDGPDAWDSRYLPQGNKMFNRYRLFFAKGVGLCGITAWTPATVDSGDGKNLRESYDAIKEALNNKYGKGESFEFLQRNASKENKDDWMKSLYLHDRVHATWWIASDLPGLEANNLWSVKLIASADSPAKGSIVIAYDMSNIDECYEVHLKEKTENL